MRFPHRHECSVPEIPGSSYQIKPFVIWIIEDSDVWTVHCLDCGIRLGTVNAGNEPGAVTLTTDHQKRIHGDW